MNWTFPAGRIFGIAIRVHWTLLLLVIVNLLRGLLEEGTWGLAWTSGTMGILIVSVLFHELAHCWMALRIGGSAEEILLWPLGGISYVGHSGSPRDEIKTAGIGPVSSFVLWGACLGILLLTGARWSWNYLNPFESWWPRGLTIAQVFLMHAARLNMILGLFNLCVPAYPLDGGRILFGFLTIRHGRTRAAELTAAIAIPIGVVITIWGFLQKDLFLAAVGIFVLIEAFQIRQLAKMGELDGHPAFAVAEYDYMPEKRRKVGFFERWRMRRAEKRERRHAEEEAGLQRDVDTVLEKVSRSGIGSLSASEREILDRASRRRRGEE